MIKETVTIKKLMQGWLFAGMSNEAAVIVGKDTDVFALVI